MKIHALRLTRGSDLKRDIETYFSDNNINAGSIVTCVGCVYELSIRMADGITKKHIVDNLEIVSLIGTYSKDGAHLHIACSDVHGNTIGGHLNEGTLINTTAELVLMEIDEYEFSREFDKDTGYDELVIKKIV